MRLTIHSRLGGIAARVRAFWYFHGGEALYWLVVAAILGAATLAVFGCKSQCIAPTRAGDAPPIPMFSGPYGPHPAPDPGPLHRSRARETPPALPPASCPDGEFDVIRNGDEECPGGNCRVKPLPPPPPEPKREYAPPEPAVFSPPAKAPLFDDPATCGPAPDPDVERRLAACEFGIRNLAHEVCADKPSIVKPVVLSVAISSLVTMLLVFLSTRR